VSIFGTGSNALPYTSSVNCGCKTPGNFNPLLQYYRTVCFVNQICEDTNSFQSGHNDNYDGTQITIMKGHN